MNHNPAPSEHARLLDLTNDAIMVRDLHDKITLWNKGAENMYGWTSSEVIGQNLHRLLQTEFPKPVAEILSDLDRDGQFSGEVVQIAKNGRRVPSLCRWVLDRQTLSILTSYTDISERKATEKQMAEVRDQALAAVKAKDLFLAAVSHELRTPLSPVLLLASEAAQNPRLSVDVRETFELIARNVSFEARLIDDLLDVSRITHGKMSIETKRVDLHAVIRDAVETVSQEFVEKNVDLVFDLSAPTHHVNGDPGRIQQVLWNLLRNAVKFTPSQGTVTITTAEAREGRVRLCVSDNGIGMLPWELTRLFYPFAQGENANAENKTRLGGLGLGLAISRMIVDLHHGSIWAESAGRSKGATLCVELPAASAATGGDLPGSPQEAQTGKVEGDSKAPANRLRVLLVEDHATTRTALTRLLALRNFQVVATESVQDATRAAENGRFDLVISDIGLPDGNGFDLMADLHARYRLTGIALTGYGAEEDLARSKAAGFSRHLVKPISVQLLDSAIADFLKTQRK